MGSEIFNLKSLYLEDTVVRGARISTRNASSTRSIEVNPGDDPMVKTGETGINKEYLIQSSLKGNDLNGYGTFIQNSDVIRGYTGAQNLSHNDRIKLNTEQTAYTVTGVDGTNVYIIEKYTKENVSDPDVVSGSCSIEKIYLDSVKYERAEDSITYDKNNNEWGVTGAQMSDPVIAPSEVFEFDTGVSLQFQKGTSNKKPDIATVLSTRKTLVSNNTSPLLDVSLSPMPYPHSSLQVFMGLNGSELRKAVEAEDYMVNYTNGSELLYPIPPYEEREVAYIKFLGDMVDEVQVSSIDASFSGNMTIDKETIEGDTVVVRPVQDILSTDDFSIKVGGTEKVKNTEYISNDGAGMLTFVEHSNREDLIDTLTYPRKLIWDGISVIKGIREEDVNDPSNLVIPGVSGLEGIDYTIYFEDTDTNNFVRDVDFVIDPESGAFSLSSPTKGDEAVLVSYYVEGEDIKDERIELNTMRLNSFPLIVDSLILTKKYNKISDDGNESIFTKILIEGIDFKVSYVTGYIELLSVDEITIELKASYTPMAQINCIARSISGSLSYNFTIIDDVFTFSQDDIGSKVLVFQVNNPVVSVPQKILFEEDRIDSNYSFTGSIFPENILSIGIKDTDTLFNTQDARYDDVKKEITLDSSLNEYAPLDGDIVVGSYTFESDVLPYAPALLIYTLISAGDNYFLIEGYNKTDSLKAGTILKVENRDPQSINYYVIKTVTYSKMSTRVDIFGTFPEDAIDPVFSIFDDQITWQNLSSDITVDTTVSVDSNNFIFNGGPLFIRTNFKVFGLLLVNDQEIYTINSIITQGNQTTVNVSPNLRSPLTSNIKFSMLPIYSAGITTLPAKKLILNDADQPAFTLWYQSPEGFEGSARILFVSDKIVIDEYVSGVKNPISYTFFTSNYQDVYTLAKAVQATASTFNKNVPDMGVPEYNPFTIVHADKELYYLGNGIWSPSTLVPFEEEVQVSLPYTFNITPELFKYTLLEFFSGKNEVTVKDADVTTLFVPGMVIALINKISGRLSFSRIAHTELISEKDTIVTFSRMLLENMIAPYMFMCVPPQWVDLTNTLTIVNHDNSKLTFNGILNDNIRVGTLLSIAEGYVYQVQEITQESTYFVLSLNSEIDPEVMVQTYSGYVKFSNVPIFLNIPEPPATVDVSYFIPLGIINEKKMELDTDYSIDNGVIELSNPISSLERYTLSYMGLDNLYENEGDSITCTCRFITVLPVGYRLDVYFEYQNIDQFYIQKLTERKFSEIVTVPQIEQIVEQKGSAGGSGGDSGATNSDTPNYEGGLVDFNYLLQDEYIKKQLYLRFYKWYKQRLRGLSAELQLGLGFKFGHSNAVGVVNNYYTLEDLYVETEDYTLTKDVDVAQIDNGYSKFFPVGYSDQSPHYYDRFGKDFLSYNEAYCCNITYLNEKNEIVTIGVAKSDRPYWNRSSDLIFKVWEDAYIDTNLVGFYNVDVPEADRTFSPSNYSFLRVLNVGDKFKIEDFKNTYTIAGIVSPIDRTYEYLITNKPFTDKGIKTYSIVGKNVQVTQDPDTYSTLTLNSFLDALSPDGYRLLFTRKDKEDFPMFDDYGSLGASAYGDAIARLKNSTRRIKKPFGAALLKLLFPFITESTKNFKIMVKKDSEGQWEELGTVDLSKLTFKEERNIDDVLDALRYDFTEKYTVPPIPPIPPITIYDIKEDSNKGFFRYFYVDLEKIYDAESKEGYYQGLAIRAKDRNWWFKFVDGGEEPIIEDYGLDGYKVYENFYDPDNIYKRLLLEKQAWQTEELIIRDLYGFSDKLARAFYRGILNVKNSEYQDYLVMPDGGTALGISDILRQRILAYEKQLRFLVDTAGPVFRTLYPDLNHAEDSASPEIATTYNQTLYAWNLYNDFYNKMWFYYNLNEGNNYTWKTEYVRWVLSLERGVIPQKTAKQMYEENTRTLTIGLYELPTINLSLSSQQIYSVINIAVTISAAYDGNYLKIVFDLIKKDRPEITIPSIVCLVYLYTKETMGEIPTIVYKSISTVCSEISSYSYEGVSLFIATNVFDHYENNVMSKMKYITGQIIDPDNGLILNSTNVVDHRLSDSRILFLNKGIEDRIYTHESRDLPAINLGYLGNYYYLKNSTIGMSISLAQGSYPSDIKHGVFLDDTGEKVLILTYKYNDYNTNETRENVFKLYNKIGEKYTYKTLTELANEISAVKDEYSYVYLVDVTYNSRNLSCDTIIITSDYVSPVNNYYGDDVAQVYIAEDATYSNLNKDLDYFYYRVYKDESGVKKLDIVFYDIIVDGSRRYKGDTISDTFTFSLQSTGTSYKTLSGLSSEISSYKYHGENIFSAASIYEPAPMSNLSTSHLDINNKLLPVGSDWETILYADTYVEAISGDDSSSRSISDLKNAEFCFPMYTANGNPNKNAIEGIPVSGSWGDTYNGNVIEIGCIDGQNWSVSFSDHESGDRKGHMAPQDIMELIDNGKVLSEDQYNSIKDVEDKPVVAVLKELILTRNGGTGESTIRFNLRQYSTINELIEAIVLSRFNDEGIPDINGNRKFFMATVVGDPEIQGKYKCYGLYSDYSPVIRSFDVLMDDGITIKHFYNILIGWEPLRIDLKANVTHKLNMSEKRYSFGETHKFFMNDPETAYIDTLYNFPQGFKRDVLAFDIYSWDYNARYVVKDNWIYFKSDSIDYLNAADLGQPDKSLGYGVPLAGSGHAFTDYRESIADLISRINDNNIVNKWFYANMKFTRDNKENPGNFEYNYLPNFAANVPRSTLSSIMLRDDYILRVEPGSGYSFTASNITIDDGADTMEISCDWKYNYTLEYTVFFNEDNTIDKVVDRINDTLAPEITPGLIYAEASVGWGATISTRLLPTYIEKSINASGTSINVYNGVYKVEAVKLTIPALSGSNYTINNAKYSIPRTRDRLTFKLSLTYNGTYSLPSYDISAVDVSSLSRYIRSISPYSDGIFMPLFDSSVLSNNYGYYASDRLLSTSSEILVGGTLLSARLHDIVAFKVLNMTPEATVLVTDNSINIVTFNTYSKILGSTYDLHAIIDAIKGNYSSGFLSCDVLPIEISSVGFGRLNPGSYNLTSGNTPAHVYFGVLGDIKFVQISDQNLHTQYNYLKQRLGMPWTDAQGNLEYDYYTPENFNENNPTAIDLSNFLGYLRTGRYNQIKNSLINEATVSNKYFWLYMKFHKEFGCDQRANMLKDAIEKGNTDISTLGQIL